MQELKFPQRQQLKINMLLHLQMNRLQCLPMAKWKQKNIFSLSRKLQEFGHGLVYFIKEKEKKNKDTPGVLETLSIPLVHGQINKCEGM